MNYRAILETSTVQAAFAGKLARLSGQLQTAAGAVFPRHHLESIISVLNHYRKRQIPSELPQNAVGRYLTGSRNGNMRLSVLVGKLSKDDRETLLEIIDDTFPEETINAEDRTKLAEIGVHFSGSHFSIRYGYRKLIAMVSYVGADYFVFLLAKWNGLYVVSILGKQEAFRTLKSAGDHIYKAYCAFRKQCGRDVLSKEQLAQIAKNGL